MLTYRQGIPPQGKTLLHQLSYRVKHWLVSLLVQPLTVVPSVAFALMHANGSGWLSPAHANEVAVVSSMTRKVIQYVSFGSMRSVQAPL